MTTFVTDRINAATLRDALAWKATDEKYTFCIDFLQISARIRSADRWVDQLELVFEGMISQHDADNEKLAKAFNDSGVFAPFICIPKR